MNRMKVASALVGGLILTAAPFGWSQESVGTASLVEVAKYGALPDDGKDDTLAVREAIKACQGLSRPTLAFAPGVYDFTSPTDRPDRKKFSLADLNDLTFDGRGATFLFADRATPFTFLRCKNLTVKNLAIDWKRPPFSQGKVVAGGADFIEVQVDEAYPVDKSVKIAAMMDFDPVTRLPLANLDVFGSAMTKVELIAPQRLKITLRKSGDPRKAAHFAKYLPLTVDKLILLRHEVYGSYALDFLRCDDVVIEDVKVYACPGMGIHASLCENITSRRVEIRIKPDSGRLMSTTADCQYYTFCRGTISVEDGYYEGMGDDGLNITAKYLVLSKIVSPTTIELSLSAKGWLGAVPAPGDKLLLASGSDLSPKGSAVVRLCQWAAGQTTFNLELESALDPSIQVNDLVNNAAYLPKAVIKNSTFRGMRSRAMLFSTDDVLVDNCHVIGSGYPGVLLKGGLRHGAEGPAPKNVVIRNSTFEGCGGAAIYAYTDGPDRSASAISNLTIEGNTFREIPALFAQRFKQDHPNWVHWSAGVCVFSSNNVKISGNTFEGYPSAIYVRKVEGCSIDANKSNVPAKVLVSPESEANVKLSDNQDLTVAPAGPDIEPDLNYVLDFR